MILEIEKKVASFLVTIFKKLLYLFLAGSTKTRLKTLDLVGWNLIERHGK